MADKPTWPFPTGKTANLNQTPIKPKLYIETEEIGISISAYPGDDPLWDTNHITIVEQGRPYHASSQRNILTNILRQAGIDVVEE